MTVKKIKMKQPAPKVEGPYPIALYLLQGPAREPFLGFHAIGHDGRIWRENRDTNPNAPMYLLLETRIDAAVIPAMLKAVESAAPIGGVLAAESEGYLIAPKDAAEFKFKNSFDQCFDLACKIVELTGARVDLSPQRSKGNATETGKVTEGDQLEHQGDAQGGLSAKASGGGSDAQGGQAKA